MRGGEEQELPEAKAKARERKDGPRSCPDGTVKQTPKPNKEHRRTSAQADIKEPVSRLVHVTTTILLLVLVLVVVVLGGGGGTRFRFRRDVARPVGLGAEHHHIAEDSLREKRAG